MLRSTRIFASALVLVIGVAGSACGGDGDEAEAIEPGTILLRPASFQPERIEVGVGETVTWKWREKVSHNITGDGGIEKKVADNGTYSHTFDKKGTFDYRCTIHPGMDGSVVVE